MTHYGLYARFYDLDYADFEADLHMVQQYAARCGSPILELGCGTGRLLVSLARDGYQVTGVDVSAEMLQVARDKVAAQGLGDRVTLLHQDMREIDLDGSFNLAFSAINSFLHMPTASDQLLALSAIHRHLNSGGLLLLDLFNPDLDRLLDSRGQLVLDKTMTDPDSGHRLIKFRTQTVDPGRQLLHTTYLVDEVDAGGCVRRFLFPFTLRYLFRGELELLLRQAGFEVEAIYGSYDLDEFGSDSDKMIAVARVPD
jgi:SAM-dependent methyltransferase